MNSERELSERIVQALMPLMKDRGAAEAFNALAAASICLAGSVEGATPAQRAQIITAFSKSVTRLGEHIVQALAQDGATVRQ